MNQTFQRLSHPIDEIVVVFTASQSHAKKDVGDMTLFTMTSFKRHVAKT